MTNDNDSLKIKADLDKNPAGTEAKNLLITDTLNGMADMLLSLAIKAILEYLYVTVKILKKWISAYLEKTK